MVSVVLFWQIEIIIKDVLMMWEYLKKILFPWMNMVINVFNKKRNKKDDK